MADTLREYLRYKPRKLQREEIAWKMREFNLTHGSGCKSRAKAIVNRLMRKSQ